VCGRVVGSRKPGTAPPRSHVPSHDPSGARSPLRHQSDQTPGQGFLERLPSRRGVPPGNGASPPIQHDRQCRSRSRGTWQSRYEGHPSRVEATLLLETARERSGASDECSWRTAFHSSSTDRTDRPSRPKRRRACASRAVPPLATGWDSLVSERGARGSVGQRSESPEPGLEGTGHRVRVARGVLRARFKTSWWPSTGTYYTPNFHLMASRRRLDRTDQFGRQERFSNTL
jgi:hypothetical protein